MMRNRLGPVLLALAVLIVDHASGADTTNDVAVASYTHPQRLVAVDGSRRLNLFCLGTGSPPVIFDAGTGGNTVDWRRVQGAVAHTTQACSYDRAGYGFSDPGKRPMDANDAVDDLHRLIVAARLGEPIVLVGHSVGGLYASLFAQRYPAEVAGMVLVDPAFRGSDDPYLDGLSAAKAAEALAGQREFVRATERCLELSRQNNIAAMRVARPACLDDPPNPDPTLHEVLDRQDRSRTFYEANYSEIRDENPIVGDLSLDDRELGPRLPNYGSLPLVVLTGGRHPLPFQDFTERDTQVVFQAWRGGHVRLAERSRRGREVLVPAAGHYIQNDEPKIVIDYVRSTVAVVRNGSGSKSDEVTLRPRRGSTPTTVVGWPTPRGNASRLFTRPR